MKHTGSFTELVNEVQANNRILIIDDSKNIHEDFRKILMPAEEIDDVERLEQEIFNTLPPSKIAFQFQIDSAFQGQAGLDQAREAKERGAPYAVAFVDVRMPPGWDGVETVSRLWEVDEELQVVICTSYSDYSWDDMRKALQWPDRLLILKKPFDGIEVVQMAHALCEKWRLSRLIHERLKNLDGAVQRRTAALQELNEQLRQEMVNRERMEAELRLAQKLEAVGQLAAGIAHEINTPVQYVGDSLHFLRDAFTDILKLMPHYRSAAALLVRLPEHAAAATEMQQLEADADVDYLQENVPKAFARTLEGLGRVATIVRAMKEFSHPSQQKAQLSDLNQAVKNTVAVAAHEYKYVADVHLHLSDIPPVMCCVGDLNQAFLNLVVNAAHAIGDKIAGTTQRGRIDIRTSSEGDEVIVAISDDGGGIPEAVRHRIFEPFFTTKEVGKGTGQGLAISHAVIVDRHGGKLSFDTKLGEGTTFFVRLPVHGANGTRAATPQPKATLDASNSLR